MSKMISVPQIGGLTELLALVKDNSAVAKHLRAMSDLRDAIAKNLTAYSKHKALDKREREAEAMYTEASLLLADAKDTRKRVDARVATQRKNARKLEEAAKEQDCAMHKRWERLVALEGAYNGYCKEFVEDKRKFRTEMAEKTKILATAQAQIQDKSTALMRKYAALKDLLD